HVPLAEGQAEVALDPWERVLLADCHQNVITGDGDLLAGGPELRAALRVDAVLDHLLENNAGQAALLEEEPLGSVIVEDRDAFVQGILDFSFGRLHHAARAAHRDGYLFGAKANGGAAAIHGGVAATNHDDAAPDLFDVAERDRGQPLDADV